MKEEEVNKIIEVYDDVVADLKQENKSLQSQLKAKEEENERYRELGFKYLNDQNNKLKEVIKEAREYMNSEEFFIKMNSNSIQPPPDKYCCQDYFEAKEKLLEILSKGENK